MRRIRLLAALSVVSTIILVGCSGTSIEETIPEIGLTENTVQGPEVTVVETSAVETEGIFDLAIVDDDYAWQLQVIFDNASVWEASEEDRIDSDWYCLYAITDLDNDGLLEVCKRAVFGNGPQTRLWMYEVTDDRSIVRLESEVDEGIDYVSSNYPDFENHETIEFYQDEAGIHYLVHDCKSYGLTSVYNNYEVMALINNRITINDVCFLHSENADAVITYFDGDGNEISEEEYNQLFEEYEGLATGDVFFDWFYEPSMDNLIESWRNWNENDIPKVLSIPTPTPTPDYYHPNFYVDPDSIPTVETVDDGVYFGSLIGISEDGTRARFKIGEPLEFTQEFVDSLEVGDALGVFDNNGTELTITSVSDTPNGRRLYIDDNSLFFTNAYSEFTDSVLICSDSVNPVTINDVYVELPISSNCVITDTYYMLDNDNEDPVYEDWQEGEPSGVPLFDSFFWCYENHNPWTNIALTDGWYNARSIAYPVVVNNGEVTGLNLEWR